MADSSDPLKRGRPSQLMRRFSRLCLSHPSESAVSLFNEMVLSVSEEEAEFMAENAALLILSGEDMRRRSPGLRDLVEGKGNTRKGERKNGRQRHDT
jgi:hypothetical protein